MYKAISKPGDLKPDEALPYALECPWQYSSITYRKRPQVKALLSQIARPMSKYETSTDVNKLQTIRIYKLNNNTARYSLIFDDKSELGDAFRKGLVTLDELKRSIDW